MGSIKSAIFSAIGIGLLTLSGDLQAFEAQDEYLLASADLMENAATSDDPLEGPPTHEDIDSCGGLTSQFKCGGSCVVTHRYEYPDGQVRYSFEHGRCFGRPGPFLGLWICECKVAPSNTQ